MLKTYCVQALLLACILLPPHHLNTLAFFMEFLKKVSLYEKQNKMSIDNLAKVIGPNIMPLQKTTMSAVQMRLELHLIVVKILIENAESIGVLPDHITQIISMETIGSTDNELDISDHLHSKSKKKKHRSGSLTRKPHLSASNLNLRMFNGLKKIVSKNAASEDNAHDSQKNLENTDSIHASNIKSTKKRKVDYLDSPNTKKKKITDKIDKSKKIRLSLDRFVPKKPKTVNESKESCTNILNAHTNRRWSSVYNSRDSQKTYRSYSDGSSHLKLILKDNEISNDLHREYNNMFIDADVNLSDDSDEQVLSIEEDNIKYSNQHSRINSSSEELKISDNFDQKHIYSAKRKLNNFETYSHFQVTSINKQSEEYVTIPKSEYEEIKNRVSAIESRLSQEFKCINTENNENNDDLLLHSVKKVQTAYEKTLEEASIENTVTADYLAKKLGKELKIRRSSEHKIIRSPSARKIGSLRRRSQEKVMSKRIRRSASWHISHGLQSYIKSDQDLNNAYSHNEKIYSLNYTKDDTYLRPISTSFWEEEKNNIILNNVHNEFNNSNIYTKDHQNSVQPIKNRTNMTVRRISSFHGNEFTNATIYSNDKIEKLKKTNSQQNMILNKTPVTKLIPRSEGKKKVMSWKDADRYFTSANQINSPIIQTGRASIAKLRTQNAGMVLAKAKLFDECTTKIYAQNTMINKKNDLFNTEDDHCTNNIKQNCERIELYRKSNKNVKNRSPKVLKHSPYMETENKKKDSEMCYCILKDSISCNTITHQKENMAVKTLPMKKMPMNITHESRLNTDNNMLCKTPHIKKSLTAKTPKNGKALVRRPIVDFHRTPLKAVSQLETSKYQNPKNILKTTRNINRYTCT
ncbi:uncharacterized protein LOC102673871 isoform X3 [Apis dorsata]|nr:uncharacterized protein LOC102673871 isoform X3 [Apis dorsata]